jgi:hypothetical protein
MTTIHNETAVGNTLRDNGMENFRTRKETKDVIGVDVQPDRGDHVMAASSNCGERFHRVSQQSAERLSKSTFFQSVNYLQNLGLITLIKKKIGRYYTMESQILLSDESIVLGELRKRL